MIRLLTIIWLFMMTFGCFQIAAQEVFDTKVIELGDGLRERIANNIQRGADGYFYIKSENYIQRWDGLSFVDIDATALSSLGLLKSKTQFHILQDSTIVLLENAKKGGEIYGLDCKLNRMYRITPTWDEDDYIIFSAGKLYTISHPSTDETHISILDRKYVPTTIAKLNTAVNITGLARLDDRLLITDEKQIAYSYIHGTKSLISLQLSGQLISSTTTNTILANDEYIYHYKEGSFKKIHQTNNPITKNGTKSKSNQGNQKLVFLDYDTKGNIGIGHTNSDRHIRQFNVISTDGQLTKLDVICQDNDRIKDIYADDYMSKLLLATYNGIYYHQMSGRGIEVTMQKPLDQKSNFGQIISTLTADDNGNVYMCSEGSGLFQYDTSTNKSKVLVKDGIHFKGNLTLSYDREENKLWSVGYNKANASDLYSYDLDDQKKSKYPLDFLANYFIQEDENNILLIGRKNLKIAVGKNERLPKIARYNLRNHKLSYIPLLDGTVYKSPRVLYPYKDYMLVGTTDGLLICDKAMTKIIKVIDENSTKDNVALKSNWIVFIKSFHNWLMVGTVGDGIFLMDTETLDCVAKVNIDNGLSDNVAVSMEADPYGNAWLTSFNGINIIDKNLNVVNTVYEHDGLSNREFSSFANVTVNGSFYFGTNNGVSIIDPVKYLNRESSKGIVIEDIEAISEEAKITKYHGYESNVVINEESSLVNINLTFPDYFNYNIGSAESELAIDSEINYTIKDENLIISEPDVGQYSINITNTKNTKSKSIDLIVKRTFPWTLIFSILGIGLLSYLISRYYVKLNRTKEAEKTEYNKKISELQLNALKAQMNPHFIFNALGSIQYFIQTQETAKADEYLSKFAKLMRLILESSKSEYISIKDEMELMELYSDLEFIRFEGLFDYEVDVDDSVDSELWIPPMIVQPLVENAINHGLYNLKDRKGLLEILTSSPSEDSIKIIVRDNGVGRSYKSKSKKPNHKSRGMDILKERISIINSRNEMHVDLVIHDLDKIGRGHGTEVVIDITYDS